MSSEPQPPPEPIDRRVGTVINGKWTIERLIGQGGMAVVYAARHRNRKRAAIKMLLPELSADANTRERFLREGYVANSVEHVGAVRVDDDDVTEDGAAYLVMELLEGETVHRRWERAGFKLPLDEALAIAYQLLAVLVAAHSVGVVHRDLKPDNLYLTHDGTLKVLDFGIARLRELGQSSTATRTGAVMGTPAFMAPEQARGRWELVDARTDLWAVGALMFTLITGRLVHQAETANETLALACIQRAAPIRSIAPDVSAPIADVIDRALSYETAARFPDAASMQQALQDAVRDLNGDDVLSTLTLAGRKSPIDSVHESGSDSSQSSSKPKQDSGKAVSPSAAREQRPPTELTAALSNHFESARAKQRGRLIAAVGALVAIVIAVVSWIALSGRNDATSAQPMPSQTPPASVHLAASAPLGEPANRPSAPIELVNPRSPAQQVQPSEASSASKDAGALRLSEKKTSRSKIARPTTPPATHAAKAPDPMSLRR
jgi:eukaryotic-like serine/threonine-protein kinase